MTNGMTGLQYYMLQKRTAPRRSMDMYEAECVVMGGQLAWKRLGWTVRKHRTASIEYGACTSYIGYLRDMALLF